MFEHLDDNHMLRLIAGEVDPGDVTRLQAHLVTCAPCRDRQRAMQDTWNLLGAWQVEPQETDSSDEIVRRAAAQPATQPWRHLAQAAAVIMLAAIGGTLAGRLAPVHWANRTLPARVSDEQLTGAIGLDHLSDGHVFGDFLDDDSDSSESDHEVPS